MSRQISRRRSVVAGMALVITLSGCGDRRPEGQTAATVNGEPITETAVDMEISASNGKLTRDAALSALVERTLLIEQAKKQKLDQRPQYTLEAKRMSDLLLSQQYVQEMARTSASALTSLQVNSYLADHPEMGSNRRKIFLKQAVFVEPTKPGLREAVEKAQSYPELIQVLQANGVKFEEGNTTVDSALASASFLRAAASVKPSEPFIIVSGGRALANVIEKEEPVHLDQEQELAFARARMQQSALSKKLGQLMQGWKKGAEIEYSAKYKKGVTSSDGATLR